MNEKYLSDEFQQEVVEKLSNEIASIIVKRVESAINNADGFKDKEERRRMKELISGYTSVPIKKEDELSIKIKPQGIKS